MEALRFEHQFGAYQVIVRSEDLSYAWERFKGRIDRANDSKPKSDVPYEERYCRYTSSDVCRLTLYEHNNLLSKNDDSETQVWDERWPVVFETCECNIAIRFKAGFIDHGTAPKVLHVRRDIEQAFYIDTDYNGDNVLGLSGNVSFLNEPGVFKLEFEYQHAGRLHRAWVTFDVVSPKLDTKHDYKSLLNDVNEEYNDVIFRYLATTYQQLTRGRVRNDIVWMNIFEEIIDDYLKNIELILRRPHQNVRTYNTFAKVEKIKRWTPSLEDEYAEERKAKRLDNHWFELKESDTTVNTRENRFVKHTLNHIGKRLTKILNEVLTQNRNDELSEEHRYRLVGYRERIHKLEHNPFFRTVGKFEGMSQDSMVLFGVHTATTEQRPDIVLNIEKKDGNQILLTYLYDAKYRVVSDSQLDKNVEQADLDEMKELHGGDYPPSDAINQMHRYRDAIYYGSDRKEQSSKEIIGGYILFPGRGDSETIAKRYYSSSVDSVNIGAFPLLPKSKSRKEHEGHENEDSPQLYSHLKDILLEKTIGIEHVEKAIPQRGLVYKMPIEQEDSIVLVGYCKDGQWDIVLKNKLYYVRAGFDRGSLRLVQGFETCKYLIMHDKKRKALFTLTGTGPRIVSGEDLNKKGFSAGHEYYLCFDLETNKPTVEFIDETGNVLKLVKSKSPYKKDSYFSTLKQLLEPKEDIDNI